MPEKRAQAVDWSSEFFELAGVMLLALAPDGRVLHINQTGAEILGQAREEILGRNWFETFLPERVRAEVRNVCEKITDGTIDAPERFENPVCRADGSERWMAWRKRAVRDAAGSVIASLAAGEDVTELRRAEVALRESEARFRGTFEQAAVGMAQVGLDQRVLRVNDQVCAITGYTRAELEGMSLLDITYPDDRDPFAGVGSGGGVPDAVISHHPREKRYLHKNGSVVWVRLSVSPLRDERDVSQYLIVVIEDISLRKQAEALRANEELQRLALVAAKAGVWQWDAATDQEFWSPEVYRLHGLDPAAGAPDYRSYLARCVHPDDRPLFDAAVARAVEAGGGEFRIEFRGLLPGGGIRWLITRGHLVCDAAHRPLRAYGLNFDVTERHALEAAVRESEERLRLAMAAGGIGIWDWDIAADRCTNSRNFAPSESAQPEPPMTLAQALAMIHAADRPAVEAQITRAVAGGPACDIEFRVDSGDGDLRWIAMRASVQHDPAGNPIRLIGVDRDVTAEKTALEALRRLTGELDHRTRNIVALVQAIAMQTLTPGPEQRAFLDRLSALLHAHSLAAKSGGSADLAELIAAELDPYPSERVSCSGPSLLLNARAVQALAMVLHELATNAAKYGALADNQGHLSLVWSIEGRDTDKPLLQIEWSEVAGRPVTPPGRQGFGSIIIDGSIAHELRGTVDRRFRSEGLQVTVTMPLAQVAATPSVSMPEH